MKKNSPERRYRFSSICTFLWINDFTLSDADICGIKEQLWQIINQYIYFDVFRDPGMKKKYDIWKKKQSWACIQIFPYVIEHMHEAFTGQVAGGSS